MFRGSCTRAKQAEIHLQIMGLAFKKIFIWFFEMAPECFFKKPFLENQVNLHTVRQAKTIDFFNQF